MTAFMAKRFWVDVKELETGYRGFGGWFGEIVMVTF